MDTILIPGKDLLKTIITDNQSRVFPEIWQRIPKLPVKAQGVLPQQILYINFEDERLDLST